MRGSKLTAKTLAKARYLDRNVFGKITGIYCKCCGAKIARDNGQMLLRNKQYAEVKIRFSDKTHHVTNCCTTCVPLLRVDKNLIMAVYEADVAAMIEEIPEIAILLEGKSNPRIVAVDVHQRGIR